MQIETYNILKQLQQESGKLAKAQIIRDNQNNKEFCEIMMFLMNNFITTGLSKAKINKTVPQKRYEFGLTELLNYLTKNNTGRDEDIGVVQQTIADLTRDKDESFKSMLYDIATKELKLGVSDETWNKNCSPINMVPVFNVMLAKSYDDHKAKVKGNFVITQKLDGSRILALIHDSGKIEFRTRQGKEYTGLNQIEEEIKKLGVTGIVLDGELIADIEGTSFEVFAETAKARSKKDDKRNLVFHVFDILPLGEFITGQSPSVKRLGAIARKEYLHQVLSFGDSCYVQEVVPLYVGNDKSQIERFSIIASQNGWEGCMINLDTPYECKRTHNLLKVKQFKTADVKVLSMYEGTGKNSGMLGGVEIEFEHEGKFHICECGSGFNDNERKLYWNNPELIIGSIIEVQYFEISVNQTDSNQRSLRFPTFKKLRPDKTEISMH